MLPEGRQARTKTVHSDSGKRRLAMCDMVADKMQLAVFRNCWAVAQVPFRVRHWSVADDMLDHSANFHVAISVHSVSACEHDSDVALDILLWSSVNLDTASSAAKEQQIRVLNELAEALRGHLGNAFQGMWVEEYRPWKPLRSSCRVDADRVPLAREMA